MKDRRRKFIKEMVVSGSIRSQAEIVALLRKKGFAVTQASVSRDLEEIGIQKRKGFYIVGAQNGFASTFGKVTLGRSGNNLIVAKCGSGIASALAVQLDSMQLTEVVGTIAGDDTVFVAVKNTMAQAKVLKKLKEHFGD
jgi:transcriptional regulator of arginine metabolism